MSKLPRVDGKKLIAVLRRAGFDVTRVRGSHHFLRHLDGRVTVVPLHGSEPIGPGLLQKILNDCDMSKEDLLKML